ncbi:short transient receptor potential channel 4-like [Branchiostoma floridae x Branchiostoma belcheri]
MDLHRSQDEERQIEEVVFFLADGSFLEDDSQLRRRFLCLVKDGDFVGVEEMLKKGIRDVSLTVNCRDACGRSAVELATIRGDQKMVETLLRHGADVGDSLLYAVDLEKEDVMTTLLSHTPTESGDYSTEKDTPKESLFPPHVTPLHLAAHRDNYSLLKLLLELEFPRPSIGYINGSTDPKVVLDYYRAVTSPSYILLTSQDPFQTAIKVKKELNKVTSCLETGRKELQELSDRLEEFSAELISFARCREEVMTVLNAGDNMDDIRGVRMRQLQKAIEVGHKKFVAHDKCQELLNLQFYRPHHSLLFSPQWIKFLAIWLPTLLTPVLAILYMFLPKTRLGEDIASPFVKFSMKLWSWLLFLVVIILLNGDMAGAGAYVTIGIYYSLVLGMFWEEIKKIWTCSVDAWNKWDLLTLLCHMTAVGCFTGGIVAIQRDPSFLFFAGEWNPFFIGSYLLAIAVILSFARYTSMLMFSETIGPLLLSLYKMVGDIFKFIVVFAIIIMGFACALQRLYSSAKPDSDCLLKFYQALLQQREANNTNVKLNKDDFCYYGDFSHLHLTIFYLFWTLYGKFEFTDLDVTSPNAVQFPVVSTWLSRVLFVVYITTSIIIMLNMLIAMMSDSFSGVKSDAEVEWRFARSREMLKYIPVGRTLPPPFNLIPTPKSVWACLTWVGLICRGQNTTKEDEIALQMALDKYKVTIDRLTTRYLLAYSLQRDQTMGN